MSYQRIEVLTGSERRRQYTEAEKERLIDAAFRSGVVVSEAARRLGVHESLLYRWRRQREGGQRESVQVGEVSCDTSPIGFIGVTVTPSALTPSVDNAPLASAVNPLVSAPPAVDAMVEVLVNGEVLVRLPSSTPPELASAVVSAALAGRILTRGQP